MKKLTPAMILILAVNLAFTQSQFQRAIGGTFGDDARSIVQTADGGYVVAGETYGFGTVNVNFYIAKLDGSGSLQWTRTVGGTSTDYANSIVQTMDGGYAVAGNTSSFGAGWEDLWVVKLDGSGNLQWTRTIGGAYPDYAESIIQTTDGGYVIAGYTSGHMYIVKLDGDGAFQWNRTVGGTIYDHAKSIVQTADGGFVVAGSTVSFGSSAKFYIAKLDRTGSLLWSRTIGGIYYDYASSIVQTRDGGFAVAGETFEDWGIYYMYIVKLDGSGSLQWSRTTGPSFYYARSIIQTTDGGYAVCGGGQGYMCIVKLDSVGTLQWSRTAGEASLGYAKCIIQTVEGGYALAGGTSFGMGSTDMYIVKFDAAGNTCGNPFSPSATLGSQGTSISQVSNVTIPTPTVTSPTPTTGSGGAVTNICTFVGVQPVSGETLNSYRLHQNYPNPFNAGTRFKFDVPSAGKSYAFSLRLVIYDLLGREVTTLVNEQLKPGNYEVEWDASDCTSGIYFYKLKAGDYSETKKMILIK